MRSPDSSPTYAQLCFAKELGINVVGKTYGQLREEIERVDDELGKRALANPALRLNNHIVRGGWVYVVEAIRDNPRRRSVSLRPVNGGRVNVVRASLLLGVEEVDPELVKRIPMIGSNRVEDLLPTHRDDADSAPPENLTIGGSYLLRLIEAIEEQTAVLREISTKLDSR